MAKGNIYTISDIHVDQSENFKWVEQLSSDQYLNDTIIIPGDITHVLSKLFATLKLFQAKFRDVYYCPGNHELWTKGQTEDQALNINNSIDKFHHIIKVCQEMGVHTTPGVHADCVTIIPLYGWYDDSLHIPTAGLDSDLKLWTDHFMCQWTNELPQHEAAKYFVQLNEEHLSTLNNNNANSLIITFSHFLTSRKLMEGYGNELRRRRDEQRQYSPVKSSENEYPAAVIPNFSLVAGTQLLNDQLQRIKPRIHIFGHSHRKMILNLDDGIDYVNNPLGYVRERQAGLIAPPHQLYQIDWQTLINKRQ